MRVAVVGAGAAGLATALLLARDGHHVTIRERVTDPRPVGAGILLQPLGQRILADLGLADALAGCSTPVRRIDGRTRGGATVLRFGYADAARPSPRGVPRRDASVGLGVHRGDLFGLLWAAARDAGIEIRTGSAVRALRRDRDGWRLVGAGDAEGPVDLVVAADGARSTLRAHLGIARHDSRYPFGVVWTVVPDPERLAADTLWQRYDDTRTTLGILPTGHGHASIFWSEPGGRLDETVAAGPVAWLDRARPYAGHLGELVERVATAGILGVRYRDVVVPRPILVRGDHGVVLVGDAAHAMSPQLGMGASLAFADAWSLAACIRERPGDLGGALARHVELRRNHIRWYTWLSRLMTPVFQSDLVPLGWARDIAFPPAARIPWVRREFAQILGGEQTSPWTRWEPTRPGGPLAARDAAIADVDDRLRPVGDRDEHGDPGPR